MSTAQITPTETAIACHMDAIAPEQRNRHETLGRAIFGSVKEVRELPDGYALRLPSESTALLKLAEYVSNERLCCAFVRFTLVIEPDGGPFWLHLTGGEGVKAYMGEALVTLVKAELVEAAGLR